MAIYTWWVFIFNGLIWLLVDWQDDLCTSCLCQTDCQCSRIQWVVHVLCPLCCMIWFFLWLGFLCVGSVHCTQYEQSCICISMLNSTVLVVYSWNRHCLLVRKKVHFLSVVFCVILKWFLPNIFFAMTSASWWISKLNLPVSRSPKKCCIGSRSWCRDWSGFHP